MAKLVFDPVGDRLYETGIRNVVLFTKTGNEGKTGHTLEAYGKAEAWNGITAITEKPSGAESNKVYADDITYLNLISNEEFGLTIEAYTYPDTFAECDGSSSVTYDGSDSIPGVKVSQQKRKEFGLAYKTAVGNDLDGYDHGYKLHLVYGCLAAPSESAYATVNDSPEAITFSWEVTTTPRNVDYNDEHFKPTSVLTIDTTKLTSSQKISLDELEEYIYGRDAKTGTVPVTEIIPYLPTIEAILGIFA